MAAPGEYRTAAIVGAESWNKSFIDDRFCQCTNVFMMIGGGEEGGQHIGTECADLTRYDRFDATPCGRHAKPADAIEQTDMNHPRRLVYAFRCLGPKGPLVCLSVYTLNESTILANQHLFPSVGEHHIEEATAILRCVRHSADLFNVFYTLHKGVVKAA